MTSPPDTSAGTRLDSWKQIAAHLNRHITTVRRWEKHEGLPVHRHAHSTLSSIYAYTSELDAWVQSREPGEASATTTLKHSAIPGDILSNFVSSRVPFLGRDEQVKAFAAIWRTVSSAQQRIAVITGEAGQGKTRLALACARLAAPAAAIVTGIWDRESLVPFAPFVTILRWIAKTTEPITLSRMLGEIAGSHELVQLAPEIAKCISAAGPGVQATAESRRFLMFDAFAQLLVALSRDRPLLVILEDLHWADTGSISFLRHLLRSTREAALCILMTHRDRESRSSFSEEQLRELQRDFEIAWIRLKGLGAEEVHRFVQSWAGAASPQLTAWIIATTGGNPLFVTELLTHLDETKQLGSQPPADATRQPSEGIREVIRHRLRRVSPVCFKVLTLGAVIGREFPLPLLEQIIDLPGDEPLDAIEEAIAAGIVSETAGKPGQFSFTHALIGETLYLDTTAGRRARLHHRVGEALERQASKETLPLEALAYHFTEGAIYDPEKAIEYAVEAGNLAHSRLALEEAARNYGMALRSLRLLPPGPVMCGKQVELHRLCGRSWLEAGQWRRANEEFAAALHLLDSADSITRCELLVSLAEASFWLLDLPALRRFANEAELLAERIGRNDLWADARAWAASAQVADGDVLGGIASDRRTLARAGGIRSFALARAPLTLYWAGQTAEGASLAQQAVEGARVSQDPAFLLYALQHLGLCFSGAGRYDEALIAFDEACAFGRQCGASSLLARATSMSVAPLFSLGAFACATSRAMEARDLARRVAFQPPLISAGIDLLLILARTHEPGRAESLLVEVQQAADEAGGWHAWKWKMRLSQARAELALARGEWNVAIHHADDVIEQSNWRHRPKYQAMALIVRARARRSLGLRRSIDDARAAVEVARKVGDPVLLAESLAVLLLQDGTDELLAESRQAVGNVLRGVSDVSLQQAFLARIEIDGEWPINHKLRTVTVQSYR